MRGLNDYSYNKCNGDADCGRQISEVLANQTAWLEAAGQGNATKASCNSSVAGAKPQLSITCFLELHCRCPMLSCHCDFPAYYDRHVQVLYLWDELLPYITSGDLIVPPGVEIIFADAGEWDPN